MSSALGGALILCSRAAAGTLLVPAQFPTIQQAIDAALPGDVVSVAPGVYFENVVIPAGLDGLVLQGKGNATVIDARALGGAGSGDALVVEFCDDVTVRTLCIRNAAAGGVGASSYGLGVDATGDGFTLDRVTLLNHESSAVLIEGDDARVLNCNANGCDGGIEVDGDNALISKCTVNNDVTQGIGIEGSNGTISKCRVANAADAGIWLDGDDNVVSGSFVFNGGDRPIASDGDNPGIFKNTIEGGNPEAYGLFVESGAGGLLSGNKLLHVPALAIATGFGTSELRIEKNQVIGGGLGFPQVALGGDGHVFSGNSISDCGGDGVILYGSDASVSSNKIQRVMGTGIYISGIAAGAVVQSNLVAECTLQGLRNNGANALVLDNIFKGNRLDVTNQGSFAEFSGNTYATGGPGIAPEP